MKKHILTLGAGVLFLLPLYGYAEELPLKLAVSATTTLSEELVASTSTASSTLARTFTLCSQEAIEARDTKIATSRTTYNTAMANALTERKNREKAAVAISDEGDKKDAIKASVEAYKNQSKAAQTVLVAARKIAWQTFESDIKKCHEAQDEEVISQAAVAEPAVMSEPAPAMRKIEKTVEKVEEKENKTIKETIKAQFENLKSLFN